MLIYYNACVLYFINRIFKLSSTVDYHNFNISSCKNAFVCTYTVNLCCTLGQLTPIVSAKPFKVNFVCF